MRTALGALAWLCLLGPALAQENLLPNPGFEQPGEGGLPAGWTAAQRGVRGTASTVGEVVHSGRRALCLQATAVDTPGSGSVGLSSGLLPAPPAGTTLTAAAWIRAREVVSPGSYYMLRYTLYFLDETGTARIRHSDVACTEGSFDWTLFRATITVPRGAARLRLSCQLTACTGTAWFDDLSLAVAAPALTVGGVLDGVVLSAGPVVVPAPWREAYGGRRRVGSLAVAGIVEGPEGRLARAVARLQQQSGLPAASPGAAAASRLFLSGPESAGELTDALSGVSLADLGAEGYCVQITPRGEGLDLHLAANTEAGRYHALQTVRQLVAGSGAEATLPVARIVDRPTLPRRGLAMGVQWFANYPEAVERLAALKGNFIINQGSFLGRTFTGHPTEGTPWRRPLTSGDRRALADYLACCREHFIEPLIAMGPRGNPPTGYSSEADLTAVVSKLADLYTLGYRQFGLNFDDLGNIGQDRVLTPEDRQVFGDDLGRAHLFFCAEISRRLQARCPEAVLRVLPWQYGGFTHLTARGRSYLRTLAQLPPAVGMVVCANDPESLAVFTGLTGRHPLLWDNWFAVYEAERAPLFVPPLGRPAEISSSNTEGGVFLPLIPAFEDAVGTSWLTAADYLWAPERYSAPASFARAVRAAVGSTEGAALLRELGAVLTRLDEQTPAAGPGAAALRALLPRLQQSLPPQTATTLTRHVRSRLRDLEQSDGE